MTQDALRERRERRLVFARIKELAETRIPGRFDIAHLKAVHAHLFQDLPEHQPGAIRKDTYGWHKVRELEGGGPSHVVHYLHWGIEARIGAILDAFGGPPGLHGLSQQEAAARLARLYGDLDHAHGFYEGNSRTLREFTRELALAGGYTLDWTRAGNGGKGRNALYIARDVAVLERVYPGLSEERAMATDDPGEYQAWWHLAKLRKLQGEDSLERLILAALTGS
ncbi:MAG TPA: Fic family protein [Acetobacteraceae bacterium]|nr:Fic family protein [Acetobacteraceae bacterium]